MLDPNKIKRKIPVNDFIALIRKYPPENIEDSGHAFKRLSQRQRELFAIEEVRNILLKISLFLLEFKKMAITLFFTNTKARIFVL